MSEQNLTPAPSATPLRRRLFLLMAAGIVPLAVMAGIGLYALKEQQDHQAERLTVELARSVANAVDSELRGIVLVLETLATTPTLDADDAAAFASRANRVIGRQHWADLVLTTDTGIAVIDTRLVASGRSAAMLDPESFERVVRTRTAAIGGLTRHPGEGWLFAVRVPVIRDGALKYVLTALVRPDSIREVLARQQVPADWVISILDESGLRVARSRAHEENLGGLLSESGREVVSKGGLEGFGLSYSLEGERIYTSFSHVGSWGWIAALGIPTAAVYGAAYRSLAVFGGGLLLSLVLGMIGAAGVARSITRPIASLRDAAEALGRGGTPPALDTTIQEIGAVGSALTSASEQLARAKAEREELLKNERDARRAAESADRAKEEFLAVLSHELRTPLNAVYGWARMLQTGQIREEATERRAKDAIVRNADIQVRLIDDLLDLSRITTGKMRLDIKPVDMAPVLQGAIDAVRPAADAKSIRIQTTIDVGAGIIAGDPARLQQVVWNLLMNAVKFTPKGGRVLLEYRRVDAHAEIVVTDTGQGIARDMLPYVFERFRQADSSTTRAHGGLGLGLALVKHLVELHGGTVSAASEGPDTGARFVVTLPIAAADAAPGEAAPSTVSEHATMPTQSLSRLDDVRVLLVDDDPDALGLAQTILSRAGAEVRTSTSAAAAFDLLRDWRPDVLVSDVEMPGEDGYGLIRRLRQSAHGVAEVPAIALTAYGRPQDRVRLLAAGFTMHVPKPVDPGELTAIVAGVAGRA